MPPELVLPDNGKATIVPEHLAPCPIEKVEDTGRRLSHHDWRFGATMGLTGQHPLTGQQVTILTVVQTCACGAIWNRRLPDPA